MPPLRPLLLAAGAVSLLAGCGEEHGAPDGALPPSLTPVEICEQMQTLDRRFFEGEDGDALLERVHEADANEDPGKGTFTRIAYASWLLRFGRTEEAIGVLETALERALAFGNPAAEHFVRIQLGVAHLRSGEEAHCIEHHNPARCIWPIREEGIWTNQEAARAAIEQFEAILAHPEEASNAASARWLLEVARMAIGEGEATFEPDPEVPRFTDVAKELGLDVFDLAGGALLDDVDGDGLLDVVTTTLDPCGQMRYFRADGKGGFEDWSERAGLTGQLGGLNLLQADYDGDGRLDLFVARGAWLGLELGAQANSLLRQQPDGTFRDVSRESGIAAKAYPCLAAAWQDYDLDGDLDLFVGGEECPSELLQNQGDGTFRDVALEAGIDTRGMAKGVAWGDVDGDGDPDLYVSNLGEPNRLYRNEGDGSFRDVAAELGVDLARDGVGTSTFASWFFDYDNDGRLDLYVGGYEGSLESFARSREGDGGDGEPLHLFRNVGGRFEDVAPALGLAAVSLPMGANHGDVDNDGWLDVYLGTGKPGYEFLVPNTLFRNLGGERFRDATAASGLGHLQKGHGIAFGDVDNDGDQDVLAQMGGFYPADGFHNAFFENPGTPNRWVTLLPRSAGANRFAVGARVRVDVERAGGGTRSIHALVGSGGSFGASSLQLELGLGDATRIARVEVLWPAGGREVFEDVPMEAAVRLVEGSGRAARVERPALRLAR